MKGIILSGGLGTRLRPLTNVVSKQLLPVYDKPMIYYPMATLLNAGITEIAIISTPTALPLFKELFGNGSGLGINITYIRQDRPSGIAESFLLAENFIAGDNVTLILGDNIFHGQEETISDIIQIRMWPGCSLFGYRVQEPSKYGVAVFDKQKTLTGIDEKPSIPSSNIAITGLYVYDDTVVDRAKSLRPSKRGELEITDLNNLYIQEKQAKLYTLSGAWLDMGSPEGLLQASNYVQTIQDRQGTQIACLEEIAFKKRMIGVDELADAYDFHKSTDYGQHIKRILDGNRGIGSQWTDCAQA
jgi:glucose-1-phosphate thymidylyltransferase